MVVGQDLVGVRGLGLGTNHDYFAKKGRAIELLTDNTFGGVHDAHTGIRMFAYGMHGWGTAKLGIQVSKDWRAYHSDPAMAIDQHGITFPGGSRVTGGGAFGINSAPGKNIITAFRNENGHPKVWIMNTNDGSIGIGSPRILRAPLQPFSTR